MASQNLQIEKTEKVLLQFNKTGLSYLKFLQFKEAIQFFKKAEKIVNEQLQLSIGNQRVNQLAGVTYNNLACYYKKTGKPKVALQYLKKSLEIEVYKINDWVSTGSTHLNICAIYSHLGKHQEGLSHARLAVELLEKREYQRKDQAEEAKSYWNIKMLCYYNMAIEEEHLKLFENSLTSYTKAKEVAKGFGSRNVGILLSCNEAISRIEMQLATLKKKMINYFMKKKEDEESGHYQFMRLHKPKTKRVNKILSVQKLNKLSLYQSCDQRKRINIETRVKTRPNVLESIERRSNSTKFKSINDYFNHKYKAGTEPSEA